MHNQVNIETDLIKTALLDLNYFIPAFNHGYWIPKHLKVLTDLLNDNIFHDKQVFATISLPPGHFKSVTLLNYLALDSFHNRQNLNLYASYAQSFAESQTSNTHRLFNQLNIKPNISMANKKEWRNTNNGGLITTGVTGTGTGYRIKKAIIDDPIKDRADAESKLIRDNIWNWFEDVVETRLEPNGSIIVCMTRWHEDDLTGRIHKYRPNQYIDIRIPALCDDEVNDLAGRKEIDLPLCPKRYDYEYLNHIRELKPNSFSEMYQGLPTRRGKRIFNNVSYYKELPNNLTYYIGADTAYTESTKANYSCYTIAAKDLNENLYMIDADRWQESITYTKARFFEIQHKYKLDLLLEYNGTQKGTVELLEDAGLKVTRVKLLNDKLTRALDYAEAWNAGRVLLPDPTLPENRDKKWISPFIEEHHDFIGDGKNNDDWIDSCTNIYNDAFNAPDFAIYKL